MPKIVKTATENSLTGTKVPKWFADLKRTNSRVPNVYGGYYLLSDEFIVYLIDQEAGGWRAWRWHPDLGCTERDNIWRVLAKGQIAGDQSAQYSSKKTLIEAIESGSATFTPWEEEPRFMEVWGHRCGKEAARPSTTSTSESLPSPELFLPKWVWYVASALVVAVAIVILRS
jgi:hypothetical protein